MSATRSVMSRARSAGHRTARLIVVVTVAATAAVCVTPGGTAAADTPTAPSTHAAATPVKSVLTPTAKRTSTSRAASIAAAAQAAQGTWTGARIPVTGLHMMNYAPPNAPWTKMWTSYDATQVDSDFADIASLGANSVRIIISPYSVGWPTLTAAGKDHIANMVSLAAAHHLAVQFTLFDWIAPWQEIPASIAWMKSVLSPFAGSNQISLVEVRNEIDVNDWRVRDWTKAMLAALPAILPGVPRTVSVDGSQTLAQQQALTASVGSVLDVIDIHLYGSDSVVREKLANAQAVAKGRPVFVGELGRPTVGGTSCGDTDQADFFSRARLILAQAGVGGFAVWTYTDFLPSALPAGYAATNQGLYGLRRPDGTWKSAAAVVRSMFTQASPAAMMSALHAGTGPVTGFDGSFECSAASLASSSTTSAVDQWVVFDSTAAGAAGTITGAGVDGSIAGYLGRTGGDPRVKVPSLMHQFPYLAGHTVTVRVQVRLTGPTGYTAVALSWQRGTTYLAGSQTNADNKQTGWQTISITAPAPTGADNFQVHLKSYANSGTAYFDNVVVTAD